MTGDRIDAAIEHAERALGVKLLAHQHAWLDATLRHAECLVGGHGGGKSTAMRVALVAIARLEQKGWR